MQAELEFDVSDNPDAPPQNFAECPAPGVYHGIPFDDYAGWKAVNSGIIKHGLISPRHFHAAFSGEIKADDTQDRKLGRAIHCRLLEPEQFKNQFIIGGKCAAQVKSGARAGQPCGNAGKYLARTGLWFCGQHGDESITDPGDTRTIVSESDVARCDGVVRSLKNLPPDLRTMLSRPGWSEASIVFDHEGMMLKGRLDRYSEGKEPCVIDVKKMQVGAGSREQCQKAILKYGYHIQAAIYCRGIEVLTGRRPAFVWVFVEDKPPFDVQVIPASNGVPDGSEDIDFRIGWEMVCRAIRMYRDAIEEPYGYIRVIENVKPGGLPVWYVRDYLEKQNGI